MNTNKQNQLAIYEDKVGHFQLHEQDQIQQYIPFYLHFIFLFIFLFDFVVIR